MVENYEEIEKNILSIKFDIFLKNNLSKNLEELEKKRLRILRKVFLLTLFAIIWAVLIIHLVNKGFFQSELSLHQIGYTLYFGVIVIVGFAITFSVIDYKNDAKYLVLNKLLSFIGNFRVEKNKYDIEEYCKNIKLFDEYCKDFCYCLDRLKGKYGLLDVDIQELYCTNNGIGIPDKKIFQGILIKIPNHKKIKGKVIVKRKGNNSNNIRLSFDDFEFSKYYNVFADNEMDAKCLITPNFMKKMVQYAKHGIAKNISLSFERGNLNIAIASKKDWFEVPFFKSATNIENYRAILLEISILLKIIDSLNLEPQIGL